MTRQAWCAAVAILTFVVVCAATMRSKEVMETWFVHGSLPWMVAFGALLAWFTARLLRRNVHEGGFSRWVPWTLTAVALSFLVVLAATPQLRVVSDETNLVALGRNLAEEHRTLIPTQGLFAQSEFRPWFYTVVDKPLLFPVLLALLNAVFGYDLSHAFALNQMLLAALLAVAGVTVIRKGGWQKAAALILLLLAQPLLLQAATSAGYELLNVFCLAMGGLCLYRYAEARDSDFLAGSFLAFLAAAHVRHESAVVLAVVATGLIVSRAVTWKDVKPWLWLYSLAPLIMVPRLWQVALYHDILTPGYQNAKSTEGSFAWSYLADNLGHFARLHWQNDRVMPFAVLVDLLALAGLAGVCARAFFGKTVEKTAPLRRKILWVIAIAAVGQVLFMMSYFGGSPRHPLSVRHFLPISLVLSLVAYCTWSVLLLRKTGVLLASAALLFLYYAPIAWESRFGLSDPAIRKLNHTYHFLHGLDRDRTMIVVAYPGRYTVADYGAIDFAFFNKHRTKIERMYADGEIRDLYVIRDFYASGKSHPKSILKEPFPGNLIDRAKVAPDLFVEIYKARRYNEN